MARRCLLALAACLLVISIAQAVITAPLKLGAILSTTDYIALAKIESIDGDKLVLNVTDDLKGKMEYRRMPVVVKPDEDAVKLNHMPQLMKRLGVGLPLVVFVTAEKDVLLTYAYTNGTWMQLLGKETDKGKAVWVLTHGEPYLRKTYKGTTEELTTLLKSVLAKKAKAPDIDNTVEPGFGPELPAKSSRLEGRGPAPFAVIPTVGLMAPLAILAILFPTVFGGVLILFRQWTAFIMMLSINSTLYLLFAWQGAAYLASSWWGSELAFWCVTTVVTVACTLWAWRRQLHNLEQGVDALETPSRTEFLVLSALALTSVGAMAAIWYFKLLPVTDLGRNLTLVLAAGIVVGLLYKLYRRSFDVMLPMATEGVMLGGVSLASLGVLMFLAQLHTGSAAPTMTGANSTDVAAPQFKGIKWTFESKRPGLFASSPTIVNNSVYAASSHPTFKYGFVYKFPLDDGTTPTWTFGGGSYKQQVSRPVVSGERVFIGEGWHGDPACKFYSIHDADGKTAWDFLTGNQTEATPTVADDKVYTGCGNDGFRCLTADTGKPLWRFPDAAYKGRLLRFAAGNTVIGGRVYVGTGVDRDVDGDDKGESAIFCLDAATGKQIWKVPMPHAVWSTPIVHRGELFVTVGNGDVFTDAEKPAGAVYCMNTDTGAITWQRDLPNGVLQEPSVDKHRVYLGCRDGNVYCLDRKTGDIVWKSNLGDAVIGTPALTGGSPETPAALYAVSTAGRVVCLAPETGKQYWERKVDNADLMFITAPAVAVRQVDGGEQRLIVLAGGNHDADTGVKATLLCLEDFTK